MMRRLVDRHRGILPLDTVEGIWRVIISTFTYVQAPYAVHADLASGEAAMRDASRFHFGFTVPFIGHMGASGVVAAVARSRGDLGLVPAFAANGISNEQIAAASKSRSSAARFICSARCVRTALLDPDRKAFASATSAW